MPGLPENPNLEHLKKQAKDLLRLYRASDPAAFDRFRRFLPAAAGKDDAALATLGLRLHDAQSAIAREYGFDSWPNLKDYVEWCNRRHSQAREDVLSFWLHAVYGHDYDRPRPALAARLLAERPDLGRGDLMLACASGDEAALRQAIAADPASIHRTGRAWHCPVCNDPLDMPALVAVTHSSLLRLPEFRERLRQCTRLLLDAGADPNQRWRYREWSLSALYGAAGKNHDAELTRMLLEAGADPNDGESLYHSVESRDSECTRLLLEAGARVERSNALHHQLDRDDVEGLYLLLAYTKDADDTTSTLGTPLLWAIRRGRSRAHIEALLAAGANPRAKNKDGVSAYRLAAESGLSDVAEALQKAGAGEPLSLEEQFLAACARCDRAEALRIQSAHPDIFRTLSEQQLRHLPNLAAAGNEPAVRLMVELGWPISVRGGDWDASALNLAVFQGNAGLTRFLLEHGASWTERHGYGGDVNGTLSWASRNRDAEEGDWIGCAQALVSHGMPVLGIHGEYSPEVADFLAAERAKAEKQA
jgi:ankyrin repeat protein